MIEILSIGLVLTFLCACVGGITAFLMTLLLHKLLRMV